MKSPTIHLNTTRLSLFQNTKVNDWSQYHLCTLRKSMQDKSQVNKKIRQQLKHQKQNSIKLQSLMKTSMISTQLNGIDFISRFQQEKYKNQCLQKLVIHYQQEIQKQKQKQYENIMKNVQNNEYDELKNILKQKQKQYENVIGKLNSSQCQKTLKYQSVKAQRRERTVFSNQFNHFQNQIFNLQEKYKELVLQRVIKEKQFQQIRDKFLKIETEGNKKISSIEFKTQKMHKQYLQSKKQGSYSFQQASYLQDSIRDPCLFKTRSKLYFCKSQKNGLNSKKYLNQTQQKKIQNLRFLKMLQNLLNILNFKSISQFRQYMRQNKDMKKQRQCEQKMKLIRQIEEDIYSQNKKIAQIQRQKLRKIQNPIKKLTKNQQQQLNHRNKLKLLISQIQKQIKSQADQIKQFQKSDSFARLRNILKINQIQQKQGSFTTLLQQNDSLISNNQFSINLKQINLIQTKINSLLGKVISLKNKSKSINKRKSLVTEMYQNYQGSINITQKSICPLLDTNKIHNSKRMKTAGSQQVNCKNSIKKLSNLIKNQSRFIGPTEIVSKSQMIKQATQAFQKEGIKQIQQFQIYYESQINKQAK